MAAEEIQAEGDLPQASSREETASATLDDQEGHTGTAQDHQGDHKRRQKARKKQRQQDSLDDLLLSLALPPGLGSPPSPPSPHEGQEGDESRGRVKRIEGALREAFQAIPPWGAGEGARDFWAQIPDVCTPQEAVLDHTLSTTRLLEGDRKRQAKYERKLLHQRQRGDITEAQYEARLAHKSRHLGKRAAESSSPSSPSPAFRLMGQDRGQRKKWQVESFAALLYAHAMGSGPRVPLPSSSSSSRPGGREALPRMEWPSPEDLGRGLGAGGALEGVGRVVDFGCGSGNLCLALAARWPRTEFLFVDRNAQSLQILRQRAQAAGLENVATLAHELQEGPALFRTPLPPFEVGIGLHCCGALTDMVMALCAHHHAACLVCPCCNGKIQNRTGSGEHHHGFQYPRSQWLREYVGEEDYVRRLSPAADDRKHYAAKCLVEWDRALWAREQGYSRVYPLTLTPLEASPKHHVLYCCP